MNFLNKLETSNWFQVILNFYTFLFVFTMFNKEFVLFGLDLRFIQLPLGAIILFVNFFLPQHKPTAKKNDSIGKALIAFYLFAFFSNIAWLWNGLEPQFNKLINEIILLSNTLISLLVFYYNRGSLNSRLLNTSTIISCCVLSMSIFLVHQGFSLKQISGSPDVDYIYKSSTGISHINAFGENFRCAGYASDPNYATILLLIGIICTAFSKKSKLFKIPLLFLFTIAIGLSFSKTIILSIIPCALYVWWCHHAKVSTITKLRINRIFIICIVVLIFLIPFATSIISSFPVTLGTRFSMWKVASEVFSANPIIGGGITSFRSAYAVNHWYVQAHSTYWQILSEMGLVGIILYYRAVLKSLNCTTKSSSTYFLTLIFAIWIITCETIALPFGIYIYYLLNLQPTASKSRKNKTALFMVNSLKQGGAEKVCLNLANELIRQKYLVDFVVLKYRANEVELPKRARIHNLNCDATNKILRIFKTLLAIPKANDITSSYQIDNGEYVLATSHLPFSNIITRLSCINRQTIYVLHISMDTYQILSPKVYRFIVRLFFKNRKVVTVSKDLQAELVVKYHLDQNCIQSIYNPIDTNYIKEQITKKRPIKEKYLLHVGRFEPNKHQDRMLQIFHKGNFSEKYHLVFCGNGSQVEEIQNTVSNLGLTEKVHFMGYQDNIYTWMKHSEVLVSTSDSEAFPMILVEAFACSAKIVASDCNYGPREILLDEYANYLVSPPSDINQYIQKIKKAIKHYPKAKNPILSLCAPERIIKQYFEFYQD